MDLAIFKIENSFCAPAQASTAGKRASLQIRHGCRRSLSHMDYSLGIAMPAHVSVGLEDGSQMHGPASMVPGSHDPPVRVVLTWMYNSQCVASLIRVASLIWATSTLVLACVKTLFMHGNARVCSAS